MTRVFPREPLPVVPPPPAPSVIPVEVPPTATLDIPPLTLGASTSAQPTTAPRSSIVLDLEEYSD
ncbi:unnamed protein product [Ilex paraguariensis]|uniref:Uncharacterized protein n=1 Tax=Ilex paraguariensis TaxID=185542 RepID=A0ABC8THU2_9AQUA